MATTNYHINHLKSSYVLQLGLIALGAIAVVLKPFKMRHWKTGLLVQLNKRLDKIYVISEGLKTVSDKFDAQKAKEEYTTSRQVLSKYRSIYSSLEKVDFFNNKDTKTLSEDTLANFYTIESRLRRKAFANESVVAEKNLTDFATQLSLSSLPASATA